MADFYQHREVPTLHPLAERDDAELSAELEAFAKGKPVTLVMPALFSEVEGEALPAIVAALSRVKFVDEVIVSMNGMGAAEFDRARRLFDRLPQRHRVIWNDGPVMEAFYSELEEAGFGASVAGKGRNVWAGCALALASGNGGVIAAHDSDILSYEAGMLARICQPVLHPRMGYSFAKSYYGRVSEQMNGRVMRLLLVPLVRAMRETFGALPVLEFIEGFRYPLAGEFAMSAGLASKLKMRAGWGLEVGMLGEVRKWQAEHRVCQVPLGGNFLHKHRELSVPGDGAESLAQMAREIVICLLTELADAGVLLTAESIRELERSYAQAAVDVGQLYEHDALFNGLSYEREAEVAAVKVFREVVVTAATKFAAGGLEIAEMPSWAETLKRLPGADELLREAVGEA